MTSPIITCPITGRLAKNSKITENYFEYSIEFNHIIYELRLELNRDWDSEKTIKPEEKLVLQGLLHNKDWPIEKETIITRGLIRQLMRFGEYPRDFEQKIEYYILKCYLNGGRSYQPIEYGLSKALDLFAKDENEYNGLINALQKKRLITLQEGKRTLRSNENKKLELTEEGVQLGKSLELAKKSSNPKRVTGKGPKVMVVADKGDSFYSKILVDYLMKFGMTVHSNTDLDGDDGFSKVANTKSELYSRENNYVVFVKSDSSDKNNTFGSILDIAIEAHENTAKFNHKYLFFAFTDDSDIDARPRLINYNDDALDFRIVTWRKHLIKLILDDWYSRDNVVPLKNVNKKEFNFPKVEFKPGEEYWLQVVYQKFLSRNEEHYEKFLSLHWDNLPKNFNPMKIHPLLLSGGSNITFYGIWMVDPASKFIKGLEDLIFAIKEILKEKGRPDMITAADVKQKLSYSSLELASIIDLFVRFDGLSNGSGSNEDGTEIKIHIRGPEQLYLYENFNSLEELFKEKYWDVYFKDENTKDSKRSKVLNFGSDSIFYSSKSKISYRDKNNVEPVMGVIELAQDLAGIIDNLSHEKERGQMIGVFGKWGRGKTFLLNEIWKVLKQNKKIKYIRLDFPAWKYQETPASWAYLYEIFAKKYLGKKGFCYYFRLLKLNFKRNGFWPIAKFILFFGFFVSGAILIPSLMEKYPKLDNMYALIGAYSIFGVSVITIFGQIHKEFNVRANDLIKKYNLKHSFKEKLGIQADIQEELIKLVKVWIRSKKIDSKKIVLFVEDIDRCTEDKIISNIDALRVLLEEDEICKRVIIVTAIDERILKNAINVKYASILRSSKKDNESTEINEIVSEYLDKLFIAAIKLGSLTTDQRSEYLTALLKHEIDYHEKKLKEEDNNVKNSSLSDEDFKINGDKSSVKSQFENIEESAGRDRIIQKKDDDPKKSIDKQNTFEQLTQIEINHLNEVTNTWVNATPRRVRIFYYRYLLCKNLLINKYDNLQRNNIWQSENGINILMFKLLDYIELHDPDLITKDKKQYLGSTEDQISIKVNTVDVNLSRTDYICLLEVLEIIIAY